MRILICGGGHVAHSLAAVLSNADDVTILTRRPQSWQRRISCTKAGAEARISSRNIQATDDPSCVRDTDLIVIALPRFAIKEELDRIDAYVGKGQTVAFIPAPADLHDISKGYETRGVVTIGFQRVPYISRITSYGSSVRISADRLQHFVFASNEAVFCKWAAWFELRFGGRVSRIASALSFAFSNAGPLLHPARLLVLLKEPFYNRMPLFYEEWTDESSRLYMDADREMKAVLDCYSTDGLPLYYESVLDHYDVSSARELTDKIRSIPSFRGIESPYVRNCLGQYVPDYSSRYFTEDVPYGTCVIANNARKVGVSTPIVDQMCEIIKNVPNGNEVR